MKGKVQFVKRYVETFLTQCEVTVMTFSFCRHCHLCVVTFDLAEVITHCSKLLGMASLHGHICCSKSDDVQMCLTLRSSGSSMGKFRCQKMHTGNWPLRSPDLSAADFFLSGCLKAKVFEAYHASIRNLKQSISQCIEAVPSSLLQHVMVCLARSSAECYGGNGGDGGHL